MTIEVFVIISFASVVPFDPHPLPLHLHRRIHPRTPTFPSLMESIGAIEHVRHLTAGFPTRFTMCQRLRPVRFSPVKNREPVTQWASFDVNPVRLLYILIIWSIFLRRPRPIIFRRVVPRSRKVVKRKPIRINPIGIIGHTPRSSRSPALSADGNRCPARCLAVADRRPCPR